MLILAVGAEENSLTSDIEIDSANSTGWSIIDSPFFNGGKAYRQLHPTGSQNQRLSFANTNQLGTFFAKANYQLDVVPTGIIQRLFTFADQSSNAKVGLRLLITGALILYNEEDGAQIGSASTPLTPGAQNYIELKINTTTIGSTTIEAKLNGSVFASGTIDITAGVARLLFGSNNSDITLDHTFDNIIINDNQGGEMDDYVGDAYINHLQIDGQVGTPQFTIGGSSPAASNYQSVNEVPSDEGLTLVGSKTLNHVDEYTLSAPPTPMEDDHTVLALATYNRFNGTGGGSNASFVTGLRRGSTGAIEEGSAVTPGSTSFGRNKTTTPKSPALIVYNLPGSSSVPLTKADIANMRARLRISTANSNNAQISKFAVQLIWSQETTPPLDYHVSNFYTDEGFIN